MSVPACARMRRVAHSLSRLALSGSCYPATSSRRTRFLSVRWSVCLRVCVCVRTSAVSQPVAKLFLQRTVSQIMRLDAASCPTPTTPPPRARPTPTPQYVPMRAVAASTAPTSSPPGSRSRWATRRPRRPLPWGWCCVSVQHRHARGVAELRGGDTAGNVFFWNCALSERKSPVFCPQNHNFAHLASRHNRPFYNRPRHASDPATLGASWGREDCKRSRYALERVAEGLKLGSGLGEAQRGRRAGERSRPARGAGRGA